MLFKQAVISHSGSHTRVGLTPSSHLFIITRMKYAHVLLPEMPKLKRDGLHDLLDHTLVMLAQLFLKRAKVLRERMAQNQNIPSQNDRNGVMQFVLKWFAPNCTWSPAGREKICFGHRDQPVLQFLQFFSFTCW